MSPLPDHYAILGVAKDAQIPEIRSAHRKLVLKCHPDKVQDPTLKAEKQDEFQKVQTAYEVLSNEKERRRYDDSLRLAELKAQLQNKANSSAPRKYDIKVTETRTPSKPPTSSPNVRTFTTYMPSSRDDEKRSRSQSRSRQHYEYEPRHSSKREASYTEKPSKREAEREREKEREREREREQREKDRRRREKKEREEEELRRAQKKEKKEKKEREKQKSKDMKKGSEEKRQERYAEDIFVEHEEEEYIPKPEKKKSSSKKHEEKRERERDRSVHRDEPSPRFPDSRTSFAQEYIRMARREDPVYYTDKPSAPTPPPARNGPHSPPKDDDIRRSSARRASPEGYKEKSRRKASREQLDDEDEPHISTSPPKFSSSPPTLNRTNSVPLTSSSRPIPVGRSKTFANYGDGGESPRSDRGRHRSKHHAQPTLDEESDSEEDHERRHRSSKHRSSKKHRSPEGPSEYRYHVDGGRSHLYSTSYSFNNQPTSAFSTSPHAYYPEFEHPARPSMHARDSGYGGSGSYYDRVKTSKSYGVEDIAFSNYPSAYGGEYSVQA
ncbi:unnamed protein product [Clonostachys rosea]|uniref:J domain-containing protein n=1 Tax=Bionectria ochroleuca TaxID=29856 RepID=A0ABY6UAL2_BIOOC|nr:unnamed protein product [Clonostachys rosea]